MNAQETNTNPASTPPITAPEAPSTPANQTVAINAPQARADAGALPPEASQPPPPQAGDNESAAPPRNPNWARHHRPRQPLVGLRMDEPRVAEQRVGEYDLRLEGKLQLVGHAGVVVAVPINATLSGTLSPAFLPLAQQQIEAVLENLFLAPTKVAFISYVEDLKTTRKAEAEKAKQARAVEQEKEQEALRARLNGKATL